MSILVNTSSEQEEKLLIAFLKNHKFDYKSGSALEGQELIDAFLDEYNREIDEVDAEIEAGNFIYHDEVEKLLAERRTKY